MVLVALLGCAWSCASSGRDAATPVVIAEPSAGPPMPPASSHDASEPKPDDFGQSTPREALHGFVRAYEQDRYDVLFRYIPDDEKKDLSPAKLRAAWKGEMRDQVDGTMEKIRAALQHGPRIEEDGDRAFFHYQGGEVDLMREGGVWKVRDF